MSVIVTVSGSITVQETKEEVLRLIEQERGWIPLTEVHSPPLVLGQRDADVTTEILVNKKKIIYIK